MCGIFFSLSSLGPLLPDVKTIGLLQNRGPDSFQTYTVEINNFNSGAIGASIYLTFVSTVLALRGNHVQSQPRVDPISKSVLCWNGEAWKIGGEPIHGNDTELIFRLLLDVSGSAAKEGSEDVSSNDPVNRLTSLIDSISGPFAFVFYDGINSKLFFGRDCLGRRSLLHGFDENGSLKICSISDGISPLSFEETHTNGLHMTDLSHISCVFEGNYSDRSIVSNNVARVKVRTIPWIDDGAMTPSGYFLRSPIPLMNRTAPDKQPPLLTLDSPCVETLEKMLRLALQLRIQNVPKPPHAVLGCTAKIAVLFSGGVDCAVLARLIHDILPIDEVVDLLNVAFENPRVVAASGKDKAKDGKSIYEDCPDRITGRARLAELQRLCPTRLWRFIAVNVAYKETLAHRDELRHLMKPHNTEMDLSIACALYFASRGQGIISGRRGSGDETVEYTTPARVLLSGLGADELFAGYARHGAAFSRHGFRGLINEINLDVSRLGKRNLGRDDRVTSTWGREIRYPYLDEDFFSWAVRLPVWERCGFGAKDQVAGGGPSGEQVSSSNGVFRGVDIEPGKKALRLVAFKLGMTQVALEKKRAIQFGSRTAKMESGKSKGTHVLS